MVDFLDSCRSQTNSLGFSFLSLERGTGFSSSLSKRFFSLSSKYSSLLMEMEDSCKWVNVLPIIVFILIPNIQSKNIDGWGYEGDHTNSSVIKGAQEVIWGCKLICGEEKGEQKKRRYDLYFRLCELQVTSHPKCSPQKLPVTILVRYFASHSVEECARHWCHFCLACELIILMLGCSLWSCVNGNLCLW